MGWIFLLLPFKDVHTLRRLRSQLLDKFIFTFPVHLDKFIFTFPVHLDKFIYIPSLTLFPL